VTIKGNVHPITQSGPSVPVDDFTPMQQMILYLMGDETKEKALTQLITEQNDSKSPLFHRYLSPQQFAAQFGVAQSDLDKVTGWLESHGFQIDQIPAGRRAIVFSGTAGQVASAFKTEIRRYTVQGQTYYANSSDPQIPAALANVVGGVVKLHNVQHRATLTKITPMKAGPLQTGAQYTDGSYYYLTPADYGVIYDINPLYSNGINGAGQSIAVIARSNIRVKHSNAHCEC
jgi:subtilase family serine protease